MWTAKHSKMISDVLAPSLKSRYGDIWHGMVRYGRVQSTVQTVKSKSNDNDNDQFCQCQSKNIIDVSGVSGSSYKSK